MTFQQWTTRLLTLTIVLTISVNCFCQDSLTSVYGKGKFLIGPYATHVSIQNFSQKFAVGVSCEYFLGRNFSFGAYAGGGADYAEFSGAILGLPLLLLMNGGNGSSSAGSTNNFILFVLMIALTAENPTVYFDRNHNFAMSLNLLKFRYIFEKNSYYSADDKFASGSLTLRLNVLTQKKLAIVFFC